MGKLGRFVLSMGKVGCIGFGGGSALIPVIEDEIITGQKLDTKEHYDKDVVVASITPGALPVELAASLGKRNFGIPGMFLGALLMAFPGAFVTVLLLTVLSNVQSGLLSGIEIASIGVSAFIMFLLTHYISSVMKTCREESNARMYKAIFVMVTVFVLSCGKNIYKLFGLSGTPVFSVSTFHILIAAFFCILYTQSRYTPKNLTLAIVLTVIYLLSYGKAQIVHNIYVTRVTEGMMLVLAVWGVVRSFRKCKNKKPVDTRAIFKDVAIWLTVLLLCSLPILLYCFRDGVQYLGNGVISAVMSFGGGDAYLTVADGLFVEGGMVTESQFYGQIVTLVNILPGSILCKTLAGVGYYTGFNLTGSTGLGIAFAVAGFACSIAVSCGFFAIIYYLYDSLTTLGVFQLISRWIRPIISGLLVTIMLSLCNQNIVAGENVGISTPAVLIVTGVLYGINIFLAKKTKCSHLVLLLIDVAVPILVYYLGI